MVVEPTVEPEFVGRFSMTGPLFEQSRLRLTLLEEPHLDRVVVFTGRNEDGFVRQEAQTGDVSSSMGLLHLSVYFLRVEVPQNDGSRVSARGRHQTETQ